MVTKQEAMTERYFHYGECSKTIGPRGGVTTRIIQVRSNGACKVWKTRPDDFRLPYKYGLYEYGYITPSNSHLFHAASKCPLNQEEENN